MNVKQTCATNHTGVSDINDDLEPNINEDLPPKICWLKISVLNPLIGFDKISHQQC